MEFNESDDEQDPQLSMGNDCEFRHSENARMNPRDCWYWLHSKCLNRDCAFRHPPMDGRLASSTLPSPLPLPTSSSNSGKAPCYYYSQGFCAKGDRCPFLHGKSPVSNLQVSASQKPANTAVGSTTEAHDKRLVNSDAGTPAIMTVKLTSALAKASSQVTKPSNVWRLSAESQMQGHLAPESKPLKGDKAQPISSKGDERVQAHKRSRNGLDKDLRSRENIGPHSTKTWSRQEHTSWEKEQNGRDRKEPLKISDHKFESIGNGPGPVPHRKDSLLRISEDPMQELSKERHVSRRVTNTLGKGSFDYGQDPGLSEGRTVPDTRVLYDSGGSGDDDGQQHGYNNSNRYQVQRIRYSDGMASATGFALHDRRKTRQDSQERKVLVEREGRASAGVHDLRNHLAKRRRLDEAQTSAENRSWVHVSENSDNYLKDSQRLHDDTTEQRFSVSEGTRPNSRRSYEMDMKQGVKMHRKPSHNVFDNHTEETVQKVLPKTLLRMHGAYEHSKSGSRGNDDVEVPKHSDSSAGAERRSSVPHSRKSEIRKEVSDFAGPKTLAQIKAEKDNIGMEKENGSGGSFTTMQSEDGHCEFPEYLRSRIQAESSRGSPLASKDDIFSANNKTVIEFSDPLMEASNPDVDFNSTVVAENGKQSAVLKRQLQSVAFVDEHPGVHFTKESGLGNALEKLPHVSPPETFQSEVEDGEVTLLSEKLRASGQTEVTEWNDWQVMESEAVDANDVVAKNSELDAEQWSAEHGYIRDNGVVPETLGGNVHFKECGVELYGRNFEAFHGEPGDETGMTDEEEEDDFAKKLGGYFS
ncbi:hypothetical protein O6H91_04G059100 [Diphasiastrum complanatum]|uniref:Uncharacterized protein n=1 Tax=Diphasiastrum complanatum TaxID=34168 RepID=A0ACC2DXC2_DIPCM|nr:hypothetical protein O6H91_04G059100 [Diphasiastrum complanatum]